MCGKTTECYTHTLPMCEINYKDIRKRIFGNLTERDDVRAILSKPKLATKTVEYIEHTDPWEKYGSETRIR